MILINVVYVIVNVFDEILKYYCGVIYFGVCVEYCVVNDLNKILL